jgi:hypothetical protein
MLRVDRHDLYDLVATARDIVLGLPDAIEDVRQLRSDAAVGFAIALARCVQDRLVEAATMIDEAEAAAPEAGAEAHAPPVGGKAGGDQPDRHTTTRLAACSIGCGLAVRAVGGVSVAPAHPDFGALFGIAAGAAGGGEEVQVIRRGIARAWIAASVRRGAVLTVDAGGGLVPAAPAKGKAVHCIAIALLDAAAMQFANVLVQRSTLQG